MRKFSFDILGDIAILKFPEISIKEKEKIFKDYLKQIKVLSPFCAESVEQTPRTFIVP